MSEEKDRPTSDHSAEFHASHRTYEENSAARAFLLADDDQAVKGLSEGVPGVLPTITESLFEGGRPHPRGEDRFDASSPLLPALGLRDLRWHADVDGDGHTSNTLDRELVHRANESSLLLRRGVGFQVSRFIRDVRGAHHPSLKLALPNTNVAPIRPTHRQLPCVRGGHDSHSDSTGRPCGCRVAPEKISRTVLCPAR
ncbi:hypothetical protein ACFYMW_25670 [Streptomyces sp. NPDC006692]|uniref:hypothetical protein n=1 Tax=unclassified Streptomyces TaxID=2593676 RepID=UPI003434B846